MGRARVVPIAESDLGNVGEFLHKNLNERVSGADWARAADVPWKVDAPNHGYMLIDDKEIVGVYLAFYSVRQIAGKTERFCNLGAWCVHPTYRLQSIQLLTTLLGQPGYHFTDLSPSGNTVRVNERLKFTRIDTATALMLNLPWPSWPGRHRILADGAAIEKVLSGRDAELYRDHCRARAANHVVMTLGDEYCYVIFRRDRRKDVSLFASVLYVSNPPLFRRMARMFGRHVLVRHHLLATLMELRVVGDRPPGAWRLRGSRPKMFRSDSMRPEQIDNLYSELVCVSW